MPSEVQDALVTMLSEKVLPIPELATELAAVGGFNLIATANVRDRGVNEMSSALRRRFNTVVLPLPATPTEEMAIVSRRVAELGAALDLPAVPDRVRGDRARRHDLPRAARRAHRRRADEPQGPQWHAVHGRGDLGDHQRAGPGHPLRRRRARRRPTSPPASSAPSSAIRCTTRSPGASTSRGWCAIATAGATSTRPAASSADQPAAPSRHPAPRAGSARSVLSALDEIRARRRAHRAAGRQRTGACVDRRRAAASRRWRCSATSRTTSSRAAFWPLADFSPEWQAARWAYATGVPATCRSTCRWPGRLPATARPRRCPTTVHLDPIGALAAAAGEPDAERWWEDVVEHRGDGAPAFAAIAAAMAAVRGGTCRRRRSEAVREAHMRTAIRARCRPGDAVVAVVCGAWHVPALDPRLDHGGGRSCAAASTPQRRGRAGRRQQSPGCRGPIAACSGAPATPPASPRRAGTATCSATPARTASPASSSTPPRRCAATASPPRPITSSLRRGSPTPWPRSATGRAAGSPRSSTPRRPCCRWRPTKPSPRSSTS